MTARDERPWRPGELPAGSYHIGIDLGAPEGDCTVILAVEPTRRWDAWDAACWVVIGLSAAYFTGHLIVWARLAFRVGAR